MDRLQKAQRRGNVPSFDPAAWYRIAVRWQAVARCCTAVFTLGLAAPVAGERHHTAAVGCAVVVGRTDPRLLRAEHLERSHRATSEAVLAPYQRWYVYVVYQIGLLVFLSVYPFSADWLGARFYRVPAASMRDTLMEGDYWNLLDKPYLIPAYMVPSSDHWRYEVPEGMYFVLGDNRYNSATTEWE